MLRSLILSATLLTSAALQTTPADGHMTAAEKSYLLDQLQTSKAGVLASIEGLTPAQWTYIPAPGVWSVQQCAEHIILAENFIFAGEQAVLATPVTPRLATANEKGDRAIVAELEDRSAKAKAPAPIVPGGSAYPTPASAAQEFIRRRDKTIAYVTSTSDALRAHSGPGPAGDAADAYQFLLILSAHSVRHTAQIREVEANAAYPKS